MKKIIILLLFLFFWTSVFAESFRPGYILEAQYKLASGEIVSGILVPENLKQEDTSIKYICKKIAPSSNNYVEFVFSADSFNASETSLFLKKNDEFVFKLIYYTDKSFSPYYKLIVLKIVEAVPNFIEFEVIKTL